MKPPFSQKELFKARLNTISRLEQGLAIYRDQLPGGLGDDKTPANFDPELVKEGAEVELEHTFDPELAQEIAIDHLTEDPDYYKKLKKVESSSNADFIIRSLYQIVGNKGYMKDIEHFLDRAELTISELTALTHLVRDLKDQKATVDNSSSTKYWKGGF